MIVDQNSKLEFFINSDGPNFRLSWDGVDQLHDLTVLSEVPGLNSGHSAWLQGFLWKVWGIRKNETFNLFAPDFLSRSFHSKWLLS